MHMHGVNASSARHRLTSPSKCLFSVTPFVSHFLLPSVQLYTTFSYRSVEAVLSGRNIHGWRRPPLSWDPLQLIQRHREVHGPPPPSPVVALLRYCIVMGNNKVVACHRITGLLNIVHRPEFQITRKQRFGNCNFFHLQDINRSSFRNEYFLLI
jgi:hypothetical protein